MVIRECIISPVSCMILRIEALKTQIDGPTLSRALAEISHIITSLRSMERINLEESASSSKSVNAIDRLDSVVWLVPTCSFDAVSFPSIGRSSLVVDKRQEAPTCSSVAVDCVYVTS